MKTLTTKLKNISGVMWACIALIIVMMIFVPNFSQLKNFDNILKSTSILIIVSIGMTMSILGEEIDLSIGGVMSAAAMVSAMYLVQFEEHSAGVIIVSILIGMAVGAAFGIINGILIGKLKFNFWLVTFATMSMGYGISEAITGGNIISGFSKSFRNLTGGKAVGSMSNIILICIIVTVIMCIVLYKTKFGMHIYAVGDSEQCAKQSGINVPWVRFKIYLLSGVLAGFGGVLLVSKGNTATASLANGYEFDAIAAVIIGGTPFEGGKGGLIGTVFGALIIQAFKSGLQLLGISTYLQKTLVGIFILLVIIFDVIIENRSNIKKMRRVYRVG